MNHSYVKLMNVAMLIVRLVMLGLSFSSKKSEEIMFIIISD